MSRNGVSGKCNHDDITEVSFAGQVAKNFHLYGKYAQLGDCIHKLYTCPKQHTWRVKGHITRTGDNQTVC